MRADSPFLANKRVFAVPTTGVAASIKCDQNGFVYAGCSGGIEIWNSGGMLQAVVEIPGESNAEITLTNDILLVELDHDRLTYFLYIQVVLPVSASAARTRLEERCLSAPNRGCGGYDSAAGASRSCQSNEPDGLCGTSEPRW